MDAMLTITGVAEIVLNVRDLPKMREFYKEVLGFKLLSEACHETGPEPDAYGDPTIAFLTIKGIDTPLGRHGHPQLLALIDFQRHVFAKGRFDGHEPTRSTLNHLAFEIPPESYEAHKERLEAFGLRPRPVTFPAMTARALFFDDPEQNVLELICYAGTTADLAAPTGHVTSEDSNTLAPRDRRASGDLRITDQRCPNLDWIESSAPDLVQHRGNDRRLPQD